MVVSSTATKPARAPASIAILQMVMRPSMLNARIAVPANSMVNPVPPAVPICPITARTMSLAVQPCGKTPSTCTSMFLAFFIIKVWVASACSTSDVPIPNANAPIAPWVEVCESPQTMVIPGSVAPCSGPITCTIPWRTSLILNSVMPNSSQFLSKVSTCKRETGSTIPALPAARLVVGTLWSHTAKFAFKRHTGRCATFRPSKACGLVTSCNNWRSM